MKSFTMRYMAVVVAVVMSGAAVQAEEGAALPLRLFAESEPDYQGGRGLITMEGVTGMFLNPTSGTLDAGQFTIQYCAAVLRQGGQTVVLHTAMASYGVTDWLEVGGFGRVNDLPDDGEIGAGGPLVRLRILKDEGWWPELSIGGMAREGNSRLTRRTLFVAGSKRFAIDEDGFIRGVRLHAGFRQFWQDSRFNEANASILYLGGEVELPWDLYLVSEVSTRDDVFTRTPFSIGMQWRPAQHVGLSLAGVQTGGEDRLSLYAGIGISFEF